MPVGPESPATTEVFGVYGPSSVTWRIHSDPLLGLAVLRFLLLQSLHPAAAAASRDHSVHGGDPWQRLTRTTEYVAQTTFGSRREALIAAARLRAIHARTVGVTPEGRVYAADDTALLQWVHCCFLDSALNVVTRGGMVLSPGQQDTYISEQVRAATLVGLEPDEVPHTRMELTRHLRALRPDLRGTREARHTATAVLAVESDPSILGGPGVAAPAWRGFAGLAFSSLPGWARRLYALDPLEGYASLEAAATTLALRSLRCAMLGLPDPCRLMEPEGVAVTPPARDLHPGHLP